MNVLHRSPILSNRLARRRARQSLARTAGAGLITVLVAGCGSPAPAGDAAASVPALVVNTAEPARQKQFLERRRFLGTVEASQRSRLGFELGGRVESVTADEGDAVAAGETIATLDTARLEARREELRAALGSARADLELAESTLARIRNASDLNAVSPQQLDEARENVAARRAGVRRVQAQIDTVNVDIGKSTLRAPYDSLVAARHVDQGDVVATGGPVIEIVQRRRPEVRIGMSARAARTLAPGNTHELIIDGARRPATVSAILPERDGRSRTVAVRFRLQGELGAALRAGDLAEVEVVMAVPEPGYWVPVSALTGSVRGLWAVYVAVPAAGGSGPAHRIERRDVEVLHHEAERAYVDGPLEPGARVVMEGIHRLTPGLRVRLGRDVASRTDNR